MKNFLFGALLTSTALFSCQKKFNQRLSQEAQTFTEEHCPQMIEKETQLDSLTYDIDKQTLTKWFTIMGSLDTPRAITLMESNRSKIKEMLCLELIKDPKWKECIDRNINFKYIYRSQSTGKEVFVTTLTPIIYNPLAKERNQTTQ